MLNNQALYPCCPKVFVELVHSSDQNVGNYTCIQRIQNFDETTSANSNYENSWALQELGIQICDVLFQLRILLKSYSSMRLPSYPAEPRPWSPLPASSSLQGW